MIISLILNILLTTHLLGFFKLGILFNESLLCARYNFMHFIFVSCLVLMRVMYSESYLSFINEEMYKWFKKYDKIRNMISLRG